MIPLALKIEGNSSAAIRFYDEWEEIMEFLF